MSVHRYGRELALSSGQPPRNVMSIDDTVDIVCTLKFMFLCSWKNCLVKIRVKVTNAREKVVIR